MENKEGGLNINTPTAVIIAGLIIAGAIIFTQVPSGTFTPPPKGGTGNQEINIAPVTEADHFYGNPKAKVVMIEFSDLECPFCKQFHPTLKKIVDESRGQVAWVYRHFPLDQIHSKARKEAQASECAAELGGNDAFWSYVDGIFAVTPSNDGLDLAELPKIASRLGLDLSTFNSCLASERYKDTIEKNLQDGLGAGATGTPTTVLMNEKGVKMVLVGSREEKAILAAIDELLK